MKAAGGPLALLLGAAALWGAARMTWVTTVTSGDLLGQRVNEIVGSSWAPQQAALAVVAAAGAVAHLAVSGWPRRALGVLLLLAAAGSAVAAVSLLAGTPSVSRAIELAGVAVAVDPAATTATTQWAAAALSLMGSAFFAVGALVSIARPGPSGMRLTRAGSAGDRPVDRFAAPAVAREAIAASRAGGAAHGGYGGVDSRTLWEALDAGFDPTVDSPIPAPRDSDSAPVTAPATAPTILNSLSAEVSENHNDGTRRNS